MGRGASPLARVLSGVGNGDGTEGAVNGRVIGTYLHGPVLARNPALADVLLCWALGQVDLAPVDDGAADELRAGTSGHRRPTPPKEAAAAAIALLESYQSAGSSLLVRSR